MDWDMIFSLAALSLSFYATRLAREANQISKRGQSFDRRYRALQSISTIERIICVKGPLKAEKFSEKLQSSISALQECKYYFPPTERAEIENIIHEAERWRGLAITVAQDTEGVSEQAKTQLKEFFNVFAGLTERVEADWEALLRQE